MSDLMPKFSPDQLEPAYPVPIERADLIIHRPITLSSHILSHDLQNTLKTELSDHDIDEWGSNPIFRFFGADAVGIDVFRIRPLAENDQEYTQRYRIATEVGKQIMSEVYTPPAAAELSRLSLITTGATTWLTMHMAGKQIEGEAEILWSNFHSNKWLGDNYRYEIPGLDPLCTIARVLIPTPDSNLESLVARVNHDIEAGDLFIDPLHFEEPLLK